jgi:regulatory protein YycH of two-component signal transduction system YycFG
VSYDAGTQDHVYTNNVSGEEGGNDDCVYSNNDDITKYRIPVTELQNVINEKLKDDGFLKEYGVSLVDMGPTIL